jgi:hypothetical protein
MSESVKTATAVSVSCEICLREIPRSEARFEEANAYVMYFCGLECYGRWKQEADGKTDLKGR